MINKGSTRNPVVMTYLRHLFWLSATYNFIIRAVHIAGKLNTTVDHVSRLHEASHFLSFLEFLHQHSFCLPFTHSTVDHMLWSCYCFLIGTFLSQQFPTLLPLLLGIASLACNMLSDLAFFRQAMYSDNTEREELQDTSDFLC